MKWAVTGDGDPDCSTTESQSAAPIDSVLLQQSLFLHHTQTQAQQDLLLGEDSPVLDSPMLGGTPVLERGTPVLERQSTPVLEGTRL